MPHHEMELNANCTESKVFSERLASLKALIENDPEIMKKISEMDGGGGCKEGTFSDWSACQTY